MEITESLFSSPSRNMFARCLEMAGICTTSQKKQNHTQVLFLYRFFIAHRNLLRTYDRRSDTDISWWCSYKSSVLTVGTFWTCYMHSYFTCKGTKKFWLMQIIFINNCVCYIGVQNLYKNNLHPRNPTNQLRYSFDIPSIKPRSNSTFLVRQQFAGDQSWSTININ